MATLVAGHSRVRGTTRLTPISLAPKYRLNVAGLVVDGGWPSSDPNRTPGSQPSFIPFPLQATPAEAKHDVNHEGDQPANNGHAPDDENQSRDDEHSGVVDVIDDQLQQNHGEGGASTDPGDDQSHPTQGSGRFSSGTEPARVLVHVWTLPVGPNGSHDAQERNPRCNALTPDRIAGASRAAGGWSAGT